MDESAAREQGLTLQVEKARRYLADAAHEVMTPLAICQGELELALQAPRDPEADQAAFEVLLGQTKVLIALMRDVMRLTSAGMPAATPATPGLRLKSIVERAVRESVEGSPVRRVLTVQADDVAIDGHEEDLVRLVKNLVENALEHGPDDAPVSVAARRRPGRGGAEDYVVVMVDDEGPGIPAELRAAVFEPFHRAGPRGDRSGPGLGLAIARELARRHGGDVTIDRSAPNTRFVATFAAGARAEGSARSGRGAR